MQKEVLNPRTENKSEENRQIWIEWMEAIKKEYKKTLDVMRKELEIKIELEESKWVSAEKSLQKNELRNKLFLFRIISLGSELESQKYRYSSKVLEE